jgi:Flp pilus assembly protein TadG
MLKTMKSGLDFLSRFARDKRANIAIIFAVSVIPIIFLTGMAIDYTTATSRQTQMNNAADAAALASITPAMMNETDQAKITAKVQTTFNAQAAVVSGVTYDPSKVTVNIQNVAGKRVVTVSYQAASTNSFAALLGKPSIALAGVAQSTGGLAPNIDFYLLLDSSPSMALPATQAGINTMIAKTPDGCAFACHESCKTCDGLKGTDYYQIARNNNVALRIDNVNTAAQNLTTTAYNAEQTNHAAYRMASYSFDLQMNTLGALTSDMTAAKTSAAKLAMYVPYANNYDANGVSNQDADTNFTAALTGIKNAMPNPGSGTGLKGDTPQEVVFLVTDGVRDEMMSGTRITSVIDTTMCDAIKSKGIRIAVLYTYYLPILIPSTGWYMTGGNKPVNTFQSNIGTTLQSCSSPGLYYQVEVGGDISAALASLFQLAVQSAYLSK